MSTSASPSPSPGATEDLFAGMTLLAESPTHSPTHAMASASVSIPQRSNQPQGNQRHPSNASTHNNSSEVAHSLPSARTTMKASSSSLNLLASAHGFLDNDMGETATPNSGRTPNGSGERVAIINGYHQPHQLHHSATSDGLNLHAHYTSEHAQSQTPSSPLLQGFPRSSSGTNAIPIHPGRSRTNSNSTHQPQTMAHSLASHQYPSQLNSPILSPLHRALSTGNSGSPLPPLGPSHHQRDTSHPTGGVAVTHISLPTDLSSKMPRSSSWISPPSSSLTALVQANAQHQQQQQSAGNSSPSASASTSAPVNKTPPLKLFLSCSSIPSSIKTSVSKLHDLQREFEKTVEEYKQLLTKLWARRRQVLNTLSTSLLRIQSYMQVDKLEILQELITVQSTLFECEESMLRNAMILLKERSVLLKCSMEEMNDHIKTVSEIIQSSMTVPNKKLTSTLEPYLTGFPSQELLEFLSGPNPKLFVSHHPHLKEQGNEHRLLTSKLDEIKTRYLNVAKQTDMEELIPRTQRYKKVIQAMCQEQLEFAKRTNAKPNATNGDATATTEPAASATPSTENPFTLLLDHSPSRAIELDFAKLLLDERTKEGKGCLALLRQLDLLLEQRENSNSQPNPANAAPQSTSSGSSTPTNKSGNAKESSNLMKDIGANSRIDPAAVAAAASTLTPTAATPQPPPSSSTSTVERATTPAPANASATTLPSIEVYSQSHTMIATFLTRLENSLIKDLGLQSTINTNVQLTPAQQLVVHQQQHSRYILKLLIQRTLFPRLWPVLTQIGYEYEDIGFLPPLDPPSAELLAANPSLQKEMLLPPHLVEEGNEMFAREKRLREQLVWLRTIPPLELGVPAIFLRSAPATTPSTATTPSHSRSPSVSNMSRSSTGSSTGSFTSPVRQLPTSKPPPPGASSSSSMPGLSRSPSFSPSLSATSSTWQAKPYRRVIDCLEELGNLSSPLDMLACLLSASKGIYKCAQEFNEERIREAVQVGGKPPKIEALGADSFFPIFLYVLIQSSVTHWFHRLKLLQRYALTQDERAAEGSYYVTTLEAGLEFLIVATKENINPQTSSRRRSTIMDSGSSSAAARRSSQIEASAARRTSMITPKPIADLLIFDSVESSPSTHPVTDDSFHALLADQVLSSLESSTSTTASSSSTDLAGLLDDHSANEPVHLPEGGRGRR